MSPGRFRPRVLARCLILALALVAASIWLTRWRSPDPAVSSENATPVPTVAFDADVRNVPPDQDGARAERPHRARVRPPAPPVDGADAETLWSFGELHLGWTPRADVDLAQHSSEELRAWIQQDLRIYELDDGIGYDEGYVGNDE